jgi:hypothetical protein
MVSQAGDPPSKKGSLKPISEDPTMDRLAEILEKLPADRQEAFGEWLESNEEKDENEQGSSD